MRQGTVAVEIKSGYGLTVESELKMLHVIARLRETLPLRIKATLLAAHAMGFGAMLTSGRALRSAAFARDAGLALDERPVCFVSIGTATAARRRPRAGVDDLLADWAPREAG